MIPYNYDIGIIGGGPVGMALALALKASGASIIQLEAQDIPDKVADPRPLALSHGSRLILQRLGIWNKLSTNTPINTIHVSNRGSMGRTQLTTKDAGVPSLGYVINYYDLFQTMHDFLQSSDITYLTHARVNQLSTDSQHGTIQYEHEGQPKQATVKLLVLADGGKLAEQIEDITYQAHDYKQWAIVSNIQAQMRQNGTAYERFTIDGPVALLPSGNDFALVWTVSPAEVKSILALDDSAFLARLQKHFGDRLGRFTAATTRTGFPLTLKYATSMTAQRTVLIGNAAQTLHPVAGQGFNLGLRDAFELAQEILSSSFHSHALGSRLMLTRYQKRRQFDSAAGRLFTDSLIKLFAHELSIVRNMSGLSLSVLDCIPPMKRFVARRMIFGARG